MTGAAPRGIIARRAATVLTFAAAIVLGVVSIAALSRLGAQLNHAWTQFPDVIGLRHLLLIAGYLGLIVVAVIVVRRAPATWARWSLWGPLLLLAGVRLVAVLALPTPLPAEAEPQFLHELAVGVLDGGNWLVAPRPMGFSALLAALYAAFGVQPWLAEVLNLALAVVAGVGLYHLVRIAWGRRAGALAVVLFALVPSQVLLVTTILTETVYTGFLVAALALGAAAIHGSRLALAIAAGGVLAVSQYVRPMSQAFLAAFGLVPFLAARSFRRAASLAGSIALTFVLVLVPIGLHNLTMHGAISLSTSSYGGWSVFVGANQEHDGRFNRDDQAILRAMDEDTVWAQSEALGRAGLDRIADDPVGYLYLWVRKFSVMWSDDGYGVPTALAEQSTPGPLRPMLAILSQSVYVAVAVLAALGLWRARRDPSVPTLLIASVILIVSVSHLVVEVQPRYHAYVVPLLCALAAPVLARAAGSGRAGSP